MPWHVSRRGDSDLLKLSIEGNFAPSCKHSAMKRDGVFWMKKDDAF
jgi:hypothetical protein